MGILVLNMIFHYVYFLIINYYLLAAAKAHLYRYHLPSYKLIIASVCEEFGGNHTSEYIYVYPRGLVQILNIQQIRREGV